jgi:general stress protein YciG
MNPVLDLKKAPSSDVCETEPKSSEVAPTTKARRPRGFAAMDRSKVSEIASKGGKAAHAAGTAHQFSTDEARAAGKKGGVAPHVRRGRVPQSGTQIKAALPTEEYLDEAKTG